MEEQIKKNEGLFGSSLKMNGKEIRDMRAKNLAMGTEMEYKGKVDRLLFAVNTLLMEQDSSLDLSPDNVFSFIKVSDFKPDVFAEGDIERAIKIRNAKIRFLAAVDRYEELFGKEYIYEGKDEMVKSLKY